MQGVGRLSFAESIAILDRSPRELGFNHTIVFFNTDTRMHYERPQELMDYRSGVICVPTTTTTATRSLDDGILRVTAQANHPLWCGLDEDAYHSAKDEAFEQTHQHTAATVTPGVH
jgi:hypothetical protein